MPWQKQPNSRDCFLCGVENPVGLNVAFWQDGECVATRVVLRDEYQGYPGVAHGGVVTALLDETMGRAIIGLRDAFAMTARLETKFLRPVPLGQPLVVRGWITRERDRWYSTEGEIRLEATDEPLATATATFIHLSDERASEMAGALPFWAVVPDAPTHRPPTDPGGEEP